MVQQDMKHVQQIIQGPRYGNQYISNRTYTQQIEHVAPTFPPHNNPRLPASGAVDNGITFNNPSPYSAARTVIGDANNGNLIDATEDSQNQNQLNTNNGNTVLDRNAQAENSRPNPQVLVSAKPRFADPYAPLTKNPSSARSYWDGTGKAPLGLREPVPPNATRMMVQDFPVSYVQTPFILDNVPGK
ncbi:hypothetical protein LTR36_006525 [Oleoguttula mirabilis]|uniref:Uncharacterized protein n=1 Tax=Oleoguttula mirabilis TaxID=1507867 RepID=A0AAV9JVA4_9PEZI|nr:hypothetical protein LTR36_006525 [Oleoguttula mirabilis]